VLECEIIHFIDMNTSTITNVSEPVIVILFLFIIPWRRPPKFLKHVGGYLV